MVVMQLQGGIRKQIGKYLELQFTTIVRIN